MGIDQGRRPRVLDKACHGGLTALGEQVVLEINRLGMLVDISHVPADAMRDVLQISRVPIIASHSSAYGLASTNHNAPDVVLRSVTKNGGVVMDNFFPGNLTQEGAKLDQPYWDNRRKLENDPTLTFERPMRPQHTEVCGRQTSIAIPRSRAVIDISLSFDLPFLPMRTGKSSHGCPLD